MTAPGTEVTCPQCGEVQINRDYLCARCGASLETEEDRRTRLAELELSRRAAERDDVSIQRLPGFGINGTPRAAFGSRSFFSEMSQRTRRRYYVTTVLLAVAVVAFVLR